MARRGRAPGGRRRAGFLAGVGASSAPSARSSSRSLPASESLPPAKSPPPPRSTSACAGPAPRAFSARASQHAACFLALLLPADWAIALTLPHSSARPPRPRPPRERRPGAAPYSFTRTGPEAGAGGAARLAREDGLRALQALLQQLERGEALRAREALAEARASLAAVGLRRAAQLAHQPDALPARQPCARAPRVSNARPRPGALALHCTLNHNHPDAGGGSGAAHHRSRPRRRRARAGSAWTRPC